MASWQKKMPSGRTHHTGYQSFQPILDTSVVVQETRGRKRHSLGRNSQTSSNSWLGSRKDVKQHHQFRITCGKKGKVIRIDWTETQGSRVFIWKRKQNSLLDGSLIGVSKEAQLKSLARFRLI